MTQTRTRNNKDNSIAWAMSADSKAAINAEMTKNGWVDMRSFGDLSGTPANGKSFQRKCENADVRTIIVGTHTSGVLRMFKAEDASKVKDLLQRMKFKEKSLQQVPRQRTSKGRFAQETVGTLFSPKVDMSQKDVKRIAAAVALLISPQLLPQYNAKETA